MSQRIGNLPANINIMNPVPNKDAKTIGVAIASRNGSEYLRSIPDGKESNNLGDLPSTGLRGLS